MKTEAKLKTAVRIPASKKLFMSSYRVSKCRYHFANDIILETFNFDKIVFANDKNDRFCRFSKTNCEIIFIKFLVP